MTAKFYYGLGELWSYRAKIHLRLYGVCQLAQQQICLTLFDIENIFNIELSYVIDTLQRSCV